MDPIKDPDNEYPVPEEWRDTFRAIVDRFVARDYQLSIGVEGVFPVSDDTSSQIADFIEDYGETLIPLLESTWSSSVTRWMGDHWVVLVDLCTEAEGVSDLVLHANVGEVHDQYTYEIHLVYVP